MYDDAHQSSDARPIDEAQESGEFNGGRKKPLVPLHAGAACCPDGAAQRVMDDLLRECLKRRSPTP